MLLLRTSSSVTLARNHTETSRTLPDFHSFFPGSILTRPGLALVVRVFCSEAAPSETPRWPLASSSMQVIVSLQFLFFSTCLNTSLSNLSTKFIFRPWKLPGAPSGRAKQLPISQLKYTETGSHRLSPQGTQ